MTLPTGPEAAAAPAPSRSHLDYWFRTVGVSREDTRELADLARRGPVVFVMRAAGVLNFLFLGWLLRQHGLPPLRAALGLTGVMPWLARASPSAAELEQALARGESAVVFLDRAAGPDPFPLLAAAQRRLGRPIFLVPALLVWTRRPQKLKPTLGEILFGTPDQPSRLANAVGFLLNRRRAVLRLGRSSDLSAFVADRPDQPEAVLGRKIRGALHFHLSRQLRAVVGPPLRSPARLRDQVLRDRSLRRALEREAQERGRPLAALEAEAARDLAEIASRYSPGFVELLRPIIGWLLGRLYDAVDIDEKGLARLKQAAGETPIVLCPSHKSYVDFLVVSWALYERGMTAPHIAAGINLAFWPAGALARRGGAFFIRRTVKGDRVYTATLRAYVKQLLRDRFPQEFFLEGGRSRSGKLLFPKTGLFSMEVDAWLEDATGDVLFVPIAIDYERLLEGRSYARELAGGEKTGEDLRGLIRARKVLGRRYGRLTVQFEEPVSLRDFVARRLGGERPTPAADEAAPPAPAVERLQAAAERRELVQALANRVAYGINLAITMTPVGLVATALLAHQRRGLSAEELSRRVAFLRSIAIDAGSRLSARFSGSPTDPREHGPVADALARLAEEGLVLVTRAAGETIYQAVEERRTLLDYHKNAVIHRYVALSLVATALRGLGGDAPVDDVRARTRWLSRLFKLEFMYRVDATFDELFEDTLDELRRRDVVAESTGEGVGRLRAGGRREHLDCLADLLRPYLEAYRVAAEALLAVDRANPGVLLDRKALLKTFLDHGRAAYAAGRIALPESVSKATLENAAEWLLQQGALTPADAPRGALAPSWRDSSLPEIVAVLEKSLPE